jgi:hypothetical protein
VEGAVEMLHPSAVAVPGPSIGARSWDTALRASSDREPASSDKRGPIEVKRVPAALSAGSGVVKPSLYGPDSTKIHRVNGMAAYGDFPIQNPSLASTNTKSKLKAFPEKPSGANINSSSPAKKTSSLEENRSNTNGKSASRLPKAASSDHTSSLRTELSTCVEIGQAAAAADRAERPMTDALGGPSLPLGNPPMPDDTVPQNDYKASDLPSNVKSTVARPPAPDVLQTVNAEMSAPDASSRQNIKGRLPVAAVGLVGAAITGLYKSKKWSRKKSEAERTPRRKEVEEYGLNPNNDPTLQSARVDLYPQDYYTPTAEDICGYRGWGAPPIQSLMGRTPASQTPSMEEEQVDEEGEEVMATKQEIRFMEQQDASSTRNALRMAAQAEQTGRNTLSRPGAQGELDIETGKNVNIPAHHDQRAEAKVSELKTLNGSLWDVHGKDTPTAQQRRERQDEEIVVKRGTEQHEVYSKAASDQRTNAPVPTQSPPYVSNMRAQVGIARVHGSSGPGTDRPLEQQVSHWFPQSTTLGSRSRAHMSGAPRPVPSVGSNATTPMRLRTHEVPAHDDEDRTCTEDTTFLNENTLRGKANTRLPSRPTISIYSPAMGAYVEPRPYSFDDDIPTPSAPGPEKLSSWAAARASPPGFHEDLPSPKWDSDMSSVYSEPTGEAQEVQVQEVQVQEVQVQEVQVQEVQEAQEAQNHGPEESKLFPKDMLSSGGDPTFARAPSSEMELAKEQDAHYSVQGGGNLTAWSGGPDANSSHEDDRVEHTEARKEPEHTSESEPGDATMSHVGGEGDGNFDLVDSLLMQWTKLSEDEYLANHFTHRRDAA